MCELYLSSSTQPHFPAAELERLQRHGGEPWTNLQGWGAAWLQGTRDTDTFGLEKHPDAARGDPRFDAIEARAYESPLWLAHLRAASSGGVSLENTQPYQFAWPEHEGPDASAPGEDPHRYGVYMHNGELKGMEERLEATFGHDPRQGTADSEGGMILLRDRLATQDDIETGWGVFQDWVADMRAMGIANFIVALGRDVFIHAHRRTELGAEEADDPGLYLAQDEGRLRLSSEPFMDTDRALSNGTVLWIRDGAVVQRGVTS